VTDEHREDLEPLGLDDLPGGAAADVCSRAGPQLRALAAELGGAGAGEDVQQLVVAAARPRAGRS